MKKSARHLSDDKIQRAFEEVVSSLDRAAAPEKLSKAEYRDLLHQLALDTEGRLEAVESELAYGEHDHGSNPIRSGPHQDPPPLKTAALKERIASAKSKAGVR